MKSSPRNKMINKDDESTKKMSSPMKKERRLKKFYFPHLQKTVEASSFEEAKDIINKEVSN